MHIGGPSNEQKKPLPPIRWAYKDGTKQVANKGDDVLVDGDPVPTVCELRFGPANSQLMIRRKVSGSEPELVDSSAVMSMGEYARAK
tara:strand:+ start:55 stop:315 length:261 start_codon:yes stop_codon:yes gene_type:complete